MTCEIINIGSGSAGNATLFKYHNSGILIDAGFTCKQIIKRLDDAGFDVKELKAILITHEHVDHVRGLRVLTKQHNIPIYVKPRVFEFLELKPRLKFNSTYIPMKSEFFVEPFKIRSFPILHDALDPVGFVIQCGSLKIGYAMDLGAFTLMTTSRLRNCHVLMLEANYDLNMLLNSQRSMPLKQRIIGTLGHTCNDDLLSYLPTILGTSTQYILIGHVSTECNRVNILKQQIDHVVHRMGLNIETKMLQQNISTKVTI